MKKLIKTGIALFTSAALLSGCTGTVSDNKNYNFNHNNIAILDDEGNEVRMIYENINKSAEFYINSTLEMKNIMKDSNFKSIILDVYDAIEKTWGDVKTDVFSVSEDVVKQDNSYINSIEKSTLDSNTYDTFEKALEATPNKSGDKIVTPKIKIIVSDLKNELENYQNLYNKICDNVFKEGQSLAIFEVNTNNPFYIFVIGAEKDLSDYIEKLYSMPDISKFTGFIDILGMDMEHPINCLVYAQNCGIMGIDYDNVEVVESGEIHIAPPGAEMIKEQYGEFPVWNPINEQEGQFPIGKPPIEQPPIGKPPVLQNGEPPKRLEDYSGSFKILRLDYTPELMKSKIEGTVNFALDTNHQNVNEEIPWVEITNPPNVYEDDIDVSAIKYIALKALIDPNSEETENYDKISGKIKIKIPFNAMSQIKLSTLLYDISTDVYTCEPKETEFYKASSNDISKFEVVWANGVTPSMGRFRIDDMENTAVLNIFVENIKELPHKTKLDIKFKTSIEENTIPVWVTNQTNKGYKNLTKFVSLLNSYHTKNSVSEDTLTCYICAGDEEIRESAKLESYKELRQRTDAEIAEKLNQENVLNQDESFLEPPLNSQGKEPPLKPPTNSKGENFPLKPPIINN